MPQLRKTDNMSFNLCGIYQWKGNFVDDWFGWYAGPGVNVGYCGNHGLGLAVVGQFGIEFNGLEGTIFPVNMATADTLLVHKIRLFDSIFPC